MAEPIPWILSGKREFTRAFRWSLLVHALWISLLFMFFRPEIIAVISFVVIMAYLWTVATAKKSFDKLTDNIRHRLIFISIDFLLLVIGYLGACWKLAGNQFGYFTTMASVGILTWILTANAGFQAGKKLHREKLKLRSRSMDWETCIYDVASNSLEKVDMNSAIAKSFPTWKLFLLLGIAVSPGPIVAILAGKISSHAQYMLAVPAAWGSAMLLEFFLLRLAIDFWTVKEMEMERGVRLVVSTSETINPSMS